MIYVNLGKDLLSVDLHLMIISSITCASMRGIIINKWSPEDWPDPLLQRGDLQRVCGGVNHYTQHQWWSKAPDTGFFRSFSLILSDLKTQLDHINPSDTWFVFRTWSQSTQCTTLTSLMITPVIYTIWHEAVYISSTGSHYCFLSAWPPKMWLALLSQHENKMKNAESVRGK